MDRRRSLALVLVLAGAACEEGGGSEVVPGPETEPEAAAEPEAGSTLARLGERCEADVDCATGFCLQSEYGLPWCTWGCEHTTEPCEVPDPAAVLGSSLCVSPDDIHLQNPEAPDFKGTIHTFCAPRCDTVEQCLALNPGWEVCEPPKHLGDLIYPNLGSQVKTCQAPSYGGKEPVDPSKCDWEKTIKPATASEANLCKNYCAYVMKCHEIPDGTEKLCCEWGCFNRMFVEGKLDVGWHGAVKCFVTSHGGYPDRGTTNSCNQPPKDCCPDHEGYCTEDSKPLDPTPGPAAAAR